MRGLGLSCYEMRMLHVKKVTIVYAIVNNTVLILYIWNNRQNPNRMGMVLGVK